MTDSVSTLMPLGRRTSPAQRLLIETSAQPAYLGSSLPLLTTQLRAMHRSPLQLSRGQPTRHRTHVTEVSLRDCPEVSLQRSAIQRSAYAMSEASLHDVQRSTYAIFVRENQMRQPRSDSIYTPGRYCTRGGSTVQLQRAERA